MNQPTTGSRDASQLPHTALSLVTHRLLTALGSAASLLWLVLLGVILLNVIMRYVFGEGRIEFEEIQWHLYACGFLLGLAPAWHADHHIRVDLVHARLSPALRAWIELYGIVLLLLPFLAFVLWFAIPFVHYAWATNEVSSAPGGLPMRWAIKAMLPVAFALLLLATISRLSRVTSFLLGIPVAAANPGNDTTAIRPGPPAL